MDALTHRARSRRFANENKITENGFGHAAQPGNRLDMAIQEGIRGFRRIRFDEDGVVVRQLHAEVVGTVSAPALN